MDAERKRKRDSRDVLGVDENADEETVKKAYHRLAKEYHPDRPNNKNRKEEADRMFQKVKDAYDNLTTGTSTVNLLKQTFKCSKTSTAVEHFLNSSGKLGGFSPMRADEFSNTSTSSFGGGSASNLSSFNIGNVNPSLLNQLGPKFASVMSNSNTNLNTSPTLLQTRSAPKKGQSLQTTLRVTFKEAVIGCNKTIEFSRGLTCSQCQGVGACISKFASSNSPSVGGSPTQLAPPCRDCSGKGVLFAKLAGASVSTTCTTCNGVGSQENVIHSMGSGSGVSGRGLACPCCNGSGKLASRKTCTVVVPPGVVSETSQTLEGEGDEGTDGGASGDLIICFKVDQHPFYGRRGDDVISKINVPFTQLILGGKIQMYTIYGEKVVVDVPSLLEQNTSGADNPKHQIVKMSNQGYQKSNSSERGNMYIQMTADMPTSISEEEKNVLESLSKLQNFAPRQIFGEATK